MSAISKNIGEALKAPPFTKIMADAGNIAWDMESYQFLLQDKDFPSIHPSLQRQAILNMGYGLYEVLPDKIYQVRGFDLTNVTFIKGKTGWIVFDPATTREPARAALKFINDTLGARPVKGWSTRTRTSITSAVCAAWLMTPTWNRVLCRSLRLKVSCMRQFRRMSSPVTR